jgi:REP element-mobilizing transposase RayT
MSKARRILAGTTWFITRRCIFRSFLLVPQPKVNQIFLYCLGCAARKYQVQIHAFCVMSNHYHLVVTDTLGQLPEFMGWLNAMLSRGINRILQRSGVFWEPGSYNGVEPIDPDDVFDKMVYTLANPVAAGLVARGEEWPGLRSGTLEGGPQKFRANRPKFFFDPANEDLPPSVELVVTPPEAFDRLEEGASYQEAVARREAELRETYRAEGKTFLGPERVLLEQPTNAPATQECTRELKPRVACKNTEKRIQVLKALKKWLQAYQEALRKYVAGMRDVVFPAGTYKMRVQFGAACAVPEPG